jgi:hypothetical protein
MSRAVAVGEALGSSEPPPPDPRIKRARLYSTDETVSRAVKFLIRGDDTFGSIWNAYEIARDDLGGADPLAGAARLAALARVDPTLLEVFYENAHHKELSGDRARHAGLARRDSRTTIVMPLEEARKLVRRVVFAWMDAK